MRTTTIEPRDLNRGLVLAALDAARKRQQAARDEWSRITAELERLRRLKSLAEDRIKAATLDVTLAEAAERNTR